MLALYTSLEVDRGAMSGKGCPSSAYGAIRSGGECIGRTGDRVKLDVPLGTCCDLVKVFPALLAEVFFWASRFVHDAYAPAVLPDLANIALNKQAAEIIADNVWVRQRECRFGSIRWRTGVLWVATYATGDLIFLCYIFVELLVELGCVVFAVVMLARSSAS